MTERSPAPGQQRPRKRKPRPQNDKPSKGKDTKSAKPKTPKPDRDFRYLEIVKLTKRYTPVTINGLPVSKILEEHQDLSKGAKLEIVAAHIVRVLQRDPLQAIYLSFVVKVDPDFPFDLETLKFNLTVPAGYPRDARALPSVIVLNSEVPRGFAVNIERGFRQIALLTKGNVDEEIQLVDGKGLLSQVQTLNKYLEHFLKQEKRQTMKFITFKDTQSHTPPPETPKRDLRERELEKKREFSPKNAPENGISVAPEVLELRNQYIEEMNQKLGQSVKLFNKSAIESRYKVQVPFDEQQLPLPYLWTLGNAAEIFLTVPIDYPKTPLKVNVPTNFSTNLLVAKKVAVQNSGESMVGITQEAKNFEKNLRANVATWLEGKTLPLVDVLVWILRNMSVLGLAPEKYEEWVRNLAELATTMCTSG